MTGTKSRNVSLFKNGESQALRIPKEFEFDTEQALITRSKNGTLTIEPVKEKNFSQWLKEWAKEDLTISCEIHYGVQKKQSAKLSSQIHKGLKTIPSLDFPAGTATICGMIRADLERRGLSISGNDLLIAAHAIHANLTLVSDNVKEFERIPGLELENWIRE